MRKVTEQIVYSFYHENKERKIGNSSVHLVHDETGQLNSLQLRLHGNVIAERKAGTLDLRITNAGWQSNTTKERLNGLPGVSINQKAGQWYLNGEKWDGDWTDVWTINK